MKQRVYVEVFKVTETCNNGNERRIKKEVIVPMFVNGKHHVTLNRVGKAEEVLKAEHYYDIEWIETKVRDILVYQGGE